MAIHKIVTYRIELTIRNPDPKPIPEDTDYDNWKNSYQIDEIVTNHINTLLDNNLDYITERQVWGGEMYVICTDFRTAKTIEKQVKEYLSSIDGKAE